jgi:plastocyanin
MLTSPKFFGLFALVLPLTALACSSSSATGDGSSGSSGTSGGTGDGGGSDGSAADAGGDDAAPVVINSCNTFVDRSAAGASRTITWDFAVSTAPERCMTVKAGQKVTFTGSFSTHPLLSGDGDKPNPIATLDIATGEVTYPKAGIFGFICGNHPSMIGAIKVIP